MISEIHTHDDPILTREEAIEILNTPDDQLDTLIERAGILRKKYKGNRVSIHILTNVRSGNCTQDCAYCAQSCRSDADIDTYKWVDDDKLYNDNDFVNEYPQDEGNRNPSMLLHWILNRKAGQNVERCRA